MLRRKLLVVSMLALFFIFINISPSLAGLLIKEGFEDGPNWNYSNQFDLSSGYLADEWDIVTTSPRSGKYCAQSKAPGDLAWAEDSVFHVSINSNQVFVRFWAKFSSNMNSSGVGTNFMRFGTGSAGDWSNGGEYDAQKKWLYIYSDKVRSPQLSLSLGDGQWHEYAFFMDFSAGIWRAWKDPNGNYSTSNAVANFTDVKYAKPFTHMLLPWYFKGDPGTYLFWMDDIEVWDSMPTTSGEPAPAPAPSDTEKPYVHSAVPGANAIDVNPGTGISLHIADKGDGVDKSSIKLSLNGQSVSPAISGTATDYLLSYTPEYQFNYGEKVSVGVSAQDLAGNSLVYSYSFTVTEAPLPSGSTTAVFGDVSGANYPKSVTDTFLNLNTENSLTGTSLNTYTWPTDNPANAILMKWDISALPANAQIHDAKLYLYMNEFSGTGGDNLYDIAVHKVINKNPDLTKATGYTYDGTNSWTTYSGSYNGIPLAQKDIAPAADVQSIDKTFGYKGWNVTQIVKEWMANPQSNYGLLLNSDKVASSNSNRFFASSETSDASQRPKLVIIYTIDEEAVAPPAPPTGLRIIK